MSAGRPSKDSTESRLYVEGADDFHVVCALARKAGVNWSASNPEIPYAPHTNGDKSALSSAFVAIKNRTPRVGLVIDADTDPQKRWQEICRKFATQIDLPGTYPTAGFVTTIRDQRLGVWMMPHGDEPGAVEAFLAAMIPTSPLEQHAGQATTAARGLGATFADKDLAKARLRTWLAWQKAPGAPYGRAIDLGYFLAPSPWADELVAWFRRVFLD